MSSISADVSVKPGIFIEAGDLDDDVRIDKSPGSENLHSVTVNESTFDVDGSGVTQMEVNLGGGNDTLTIGPGVRIPIRIDGGAGYNVLIGVDDSKDTVIDGPGVNMVVPARRQDDGAHDPFI